MPRLRLIQGVGDARGGEGVMAEKHVVSCDGCGAESEMVDKRERDGMTLKVTGSSFIVSSPSDGDGRSPRQRNRFWYAPTGWREEADHDFCSKRCYGMWLQQSDSAC